MDTKKDAYGQAVWAFFQVKESYQSKSVKNSLVNINYFLKLILCDLFSILLIL